MEKILNFRKLANGMKNIEGREIKNVYRSADVSFATQEDVNQLFLKKIHNIIDLRSTEEINQYPQLNHENIEIKQIDIIGNGTQNDVDKFRLEELNDFMVLLYKNKFVKSSGFKTEFEYILSLKGKPFLFHCTAGKDRTGITGVILMNILGFTKEQIIDEYLKIDEELVNNIAEKFISGFLGEDVDEITDEIRAVASVRPQFIAGFYDGIELEYGNFDNYLEKKLCITEEQKRALRNDYLM